MCWRLKCSSADCDPTMWCGSLRPERTRSGYHLRQFCLSCVEDPRVSSIRTQRVHDIPELKTHSIDQHSRRIDSGPHPLLTDMIAFHDAYCGGQRNRHSETQNSKRSRRDHPFLPDRHAGLCATLRARRACNFLIRQKTVCPVHRISVEIPSDFCVISRRRTDIAKNTYEMLLPHYNFQCKYYRGKAEKGMKWHVRRNSSLPLGTDVVVQTFGTFGSFFWRKARCLPHSCHRYCNQFRHQVRLAS